MRTKLKKLYYSYLNKSIYTFYKVLKQKLEGLQSTKRKKNDIIGNDNVRT